MWRAGASGHLSGPASQPAWRSPPLIGSIWCKLTHFVGGNRSREAARGETAESAAAALIPLTGSVKSAFQKGCSPVMSPPE